MAMAADILFADLLENELQLSASAPLEKPFHKLESVNERIKELEGDKTLLQEYLDNSAERYETLASQVSKQLPMHTAKLEALETWCKQDNLQLSNA
jgi:predicted nuclease with TOPRIM domain